MIESLPERLLHHRLLTPIGAALLITDPQQHLRALDWEDYEPRFLQLLRVHYGATPSLRSAPPPAWLRSALEAYFAGELAPIRALSCATNGTPFQREVWTALRTIPGGVTWSYGELARRLGRPLAARAVGRANGSNPIGVVVPCHRVVGKGGSLTGYGGGLERKRWLLDHEQAARGAASAAPMR